MADDTHLYRRRRSGNQTIMTRIGHRWVDVVFAAMMRMHVPERHHATLLEYAEGGFALPQLAIVMRLMNGDDGFQPDVAEMDGEWWNSDSELAVTAEFADGATWKGGRLTVATPTRSDTIRIGLNGRPLSALVDHPYLPGDLRIAGIGVQGIQGDKWNVMLLLPGESVP